MSVHVPSRPLWYCVACGQPWPCPTRREQLLAEYDGSQVSLGLYLSSCLVEAARDLRQGAAGVLYLRFLAWLRDRPAAPSAGRD